MMTMTPERLAEVTKEVTEAMAPRPTVDIRAGTLMELLILRLNLTLDPVPLAGLTQLHEHVVGECEEALIRYVMARTGFNQVQAARHLGINRNTLRKRWFEYAAADRAAWAAARPAEDLA